MIIKAFKELRTWTYKYHPFRGFDNNYQQAKNK